ncbi:MAG: ATP-binding protein [Candidatus Margulisbacteria bacterium]|nr:ATP-binding protein [Candidatus Margulisiibacteriota bacterium]
MQTEIGRLLLYIRIKWVVIISIFLLVATETIIGIVQPIATMSSFVALVIASLTNLVLFYIIKRKQPYTLTSYLFLLFDLALVILALYFNGGLENTWLFLPVLLIFFSGYIFTMRVSLSLAALAYAGILAISLLEYFEVIPHLTIYNIQNFLRNNLEYNIDNLVGLFLLYFASAFSSGYINQIMRNTFKDLENSMLNYKASQEESEASRKALMNIMEDLGKTKDELEIRVSQRTSELEEAKTNLEKKVFDRTVDLEESRKAILHMMKDLKEDMFKLQTIDRLKTEFLSMVSHELRTPMTPIKGYVSLFLSGKMGSLLPAQIEAIKVISRQSEHLLDLIESILDVSRLELGKPIPTKMEPLSLEKVVREVLEANIINFENRGLSYQLDISNNLPTILGDEIKIKRILTNLIGNSIKFTPKGGALQIRVSLDDSNAQVEVSDNGIGLAKEHMEKIFEKFFQVDSSYTRATGGIGMGLAIAKELAELHGGRIWAKSDGLGKGSSFFFTIPIGKKGGE